MRYLKLFEGSEPKLYKEITNTISSTIKETENGVDIQPGLLNRLMRINFVCKHNFEIHKWTPSWSLTNCKFLINSEINTDLDTIHIIYEISDEYYIIKIFGHELIAPVGYRGDTRFGKRMVEVQHYYLVDGWDGMMQLFNDWKLIKKD
jgi:hypothetical protein